jgi:hypothetical protein
MKKVSEKSRAEKLYYITVAKQNDGIGGGVEKIIDKVTKRYGRSRISDLPGRELEDLYSQVWIYENPLKGGVSEGMTMQDIAKKHRVVLREVINAVNEGTEVELEHTSDRIIAEEIAKDHVSEDLMYYKKLAKMEETNLSDIKLDKGYVDKAVIDVSEDEGMKEREREKMDIIRDVVEFDETRGKADTTSVEREFLKDGEVIFKLDGKYHTPEDTMPAYLTSRKTLSVSDTFNYHPYGGMGEIDLKKFKENFTEAYKQILSREEEEPISGYEDLWEKTQSGDKEKIKEVRDWYNSVHQNLKDRFIEFQLNEFRSDMATMGRNEETGEQWTIDEVREQFEYLISAEADMTGLHKEEEKKYILISHTEDRGYFYARTYDTATNSFETTSDENSALALPMKEADELAQRINKEAKENGFRFGIVGYYPETSEKEKEEGYEEYEQWLHGNKSFTQEEYKFLTLVLEMSSPRDMVGTNEGFEDFRRNRVIIESLITKIEGYQSK